MKRLQFIFIALFYFALQNIAQGIIEKSAKKRPIWFTDKPISKDYSYYIGMGEDNSLQKAQQAAVNDVLHQLSNTAGVNISSENKTKISNQTINNDVNTTMEFEAVIIGTGEKIMVKGLRKEEVYWQRRSSKYEYWILMRKPKRINIDPNFDSTIKYSIYKSLF